MFKTILFAGVLTALSSISLLGCTDADLGEDSSELTGFCIRGEQCRDICIGVGSEQVCHEFCTLDIGPCEPGSGSGSGSGSGGDCENDEDNPPDLCGGGGSRVP